MSSNYGAQIQMRYNRYKNKIETKLISRPGSPKPYPNLQIEVDAFSDAIKASGYERMKIFLDPEYYKVTKNVTSTAAGKSYREEISLDHIRVDPNEDTYKIHIMNIDLQKDKTIGVRLLDASGSPSLSAPARFSLNNVSFELGV
jgi:hypothetical protein